MFDFAVRGFQGSVDHCYAVSGAGCDAAVFNDEVSGFHGSAVLRARGASGPCLAVRGEADPRARVRRPMFLPPPRCVCAMSLPSGHLYDPNMIWHEACVAFTALFEKGEERKHLRKWL